MRKLVVIFLFLCGVAEGSDLHQFDVDLGIDQWTIQLRHDPQIDYSHIQAAVDLTDRTTFEIRYGRSTLFDEYEIRSRLLVEYKWGLTDNTEFAYKNYFEYRVFGDKDNAFRYRGKLKLAYTLGAFEPYISERFNIQERKGLYEHELEAGFEYQITERLTLGGFYRHVANDHFNLSYTMTGSLIEYRFD